MLRIDVFLQLALTRALAIAEHAISVLFFDMSLELCVCSETQICGRTVGFDRIGNGALAAEELGNTMYTLLMSTKSCSTIEASFTIIEGNGIDVCTWKRGKF